MIAFNARTAKSTPPATAGASGEISGRNSTAQQTNSRHARQITTIAALVLATWIATPARAEPAASRDDDVAAPPASADYDAVLDDAVAAFDKEDYARARVLFERALELRPNARVLRGLGIAALHLKRFTSAKAELSAALTDTRQPLTVAQRQGVSDILSWMQTHLGTVRLQLHPSNARITLDEQPVVSTELVMEPGLHRLRVTAEHFEPQEHSIRIDAGESRQFDVSLLPRPTEPAVIPAEVAAAAPQSDGPRERWARPLEPATPRARDGESSSVLGEWWFWTAVGVVVAGGVATAVVVTSKAPEPSFEKGGLGGVIMPLGRIP